MTHMEICRKCKWKWIHSGFGYFMPDAEYVACRYQSGMTCPTMFSDNDVYENKNWHERDCVYQLEHLMVPTKPWYIRLWVYVNEKAVF